MIRTPLTFPRQSRSPVADATGGDPRLMTALFSKDGGHHFHRGVVFPIESCTVCKGKCTTLTACERPEPEPRLSVWRRLWLAFVRFWGWC
jgi:hypothetical protein